MKNLQAMALVLLLSGGLVGLTACNRADTGESYIREEAPDRVQLDREEQQSFMREEQSGTMDGDSFYTREGDEPYTGENKGVGYEGE